MHLTLPPIVEKVITNTVLLMYYTSSSPFPVAISTVIATANPTMASRPSHTSTVFPPWVLCSHLMETGTALQTGFLSQLVEITRDKGKHQYELSILVEFALPRTPQNIPKGKSIVMMMDKTTKTS